jgi:hypothetical protein
MTLGLDFGSSSFRSLRYEGELKARRCRAVYTLLADTPSQRRLLAQSGVSFHHCGEQLVILGDAALDWSRLMRSPLVPLLPLGKLPNSDPLSKQILVSIVDAVVPVSKTANENCCLTVPSGGRINGLTDEAEVNYFTQLLRLRGYRPIVMGQSHAFALAELAKEGYSGVTIVFGASTSEVSVIHSGRELARCVIGRGGDWIDAQLASEAEDYFFDHKGGQWLNTVPMQQKKEATPLTTDGATVSQNDFAGRVYRLTREMIEYVLLEAASQFSLLPAVKRLPQPAVLTYGGGSAHAIGFSGLMERAVAHADWPIKLRLVRSGELSPYTIARGALIHAELEPAIANSAA